MSKTKATGEVEEKIQEIKLTRQIASKIIRGLSIALQKAHRRIVKCVVVWRWVPVRYKGKITGLCLVGKGGRCRKGFITKAMNMPGVYLWSPYYAERERASTPREAMRKCVKVLCASDDSAFRHGDIVTVSAGAERWIEAQKKARKKLALFLATRRTCVSCHAWRPTPKTP